MNTSKNILVVDDSDVEFDLIQLGLEAIGCLHHISRCKTAEEALDTLGIDPETYRQVEVEKLPDLILLDINMPGMGGLGFLRVLRNLVLPLRIPVVVMSSSCNPADISVSYQLGAAGYVDKPDRWQDYEVKIRDVLVSYCDDG
jgi:CheY-like chemotaxis protein